MADILGSVKITGFISPTDTNDSFATHDAIYGKGGLRSVDTIDSRNAITTARRSEGMMVYVEANQKIYILKNGIENSNWEEFSGGVGDIADGKIIIGDGNDGGTVQSGYTMPKTDGAAGEVLQTDGNGVVTFQNIVETLSLAIIEELNATSNYQIQGGDLNGDGQVGTADLLIFLSQFGTSVSSLSQEFSFNSNSQNYTILTSSVDDIESATESELSILNIPSGPDSASAYAPWNWSYNTSADYIKLYTTDASQAGTNQISRDLDVFPPIGGNLRLYIQRSAAVDVDVALYLKITAEYAVNEPVSAFHYITTFSFSGEVSNTQEHADALGGTVQSQNVFNQPLETSIGSGVYELPIAIKVYFYACANWSEGEVSIKLNSARLKCDNS